MKNVNKTYLAVILLGALIVSPCLLIVSQGEDGEPTIWNLIGLAYTFALVAVVKKLKLLED